LAISTPRPLAPDMKMLAAACFCTASTPMAPMYLDHLSLTASSSISMSLPVFLLVSIYSSSTSISSRFAWPSVISFFFWADFFYLCFFLATLEMSWGLSNLFKTSVKSLIHSCNMFL
jgi:hypothetical protein